MALNKVIRAMKILAVSSSLSERRGLSTRCSFYRSLRVSRRASRSDKPVSGKRAVAETDLAHLPSGLYARLRYGYARAAGKKGVRTVISPGANRQTLTIGNRFLWQRAPRRDVPTKSLMARKKSH